MLLDFLHLSRNRYAYFRNRASKVGMLHWTWSLLTLALQGRLYRALHPKLYATRNLCMHDFLKLDHNWDAYMRVQKERKSTFSTAFEHREKEARSLFAAQYWYRSLLHNIESRTINAQINISSEKSRKFDTLAKLLYCILTRLSGNLRTYWNYNGTQSYKLNRWIMKTCHGVYSFALTIRSQVRTKP